MFDSVANGKVIRGYVKKLAPKMHVKTERSWISITGENGMFNEEEQKVLHSLKLIDRLPYLTNSHVIAPEDQEAVIRELNRMREANVI